MKWRLRIRHLQGVRSGTAPGKPRPKILFITSTRLGDAVLSTGVLDHVRSLRPDARVTVACGPIPAPIFADLPGLDRVIPFERGNGPRFAHWIGLRKELADGRWSDVIDLRSPFFAYFLQADHRWICRAEKRREHRVEELARQLRLPTVPAPRLHVSEERRRMAAELKGPGPLLAVGSTANWGGKQWPADRFAETVRRLVGAGGILEGAGVAIVGAAHEREMAKPVLDAVPGALDWVGGRDLLDVCALLELSDLYIGNDSGLMHLAAAAGAPTLGLFGPSAEWRYRPWGPRSALVRTTESLDELTSAPDFDHRSHRSLMTSLTVDEVVCAAEDLWRRAARPNPSGSPRSAIDAAGR